MRGRGHHHHGHHGHHHHGHHGHHHHNTASQQPLHRRYHHNTVSQQPLHMRYDFDWESKPSTNGEFKYGLFQCCGGPTETISVVCLFFMSVIPWPGWFLIAQANYELGKVIGTNLNLILLIFAKLIGLKYLFNYY